jgi:hypothetical protein
MRYHTKDPSERAAAIADREATRLCHKAGHYGGYNTLVAEIYRQTLLEFNFQPDFVTPRPPAPPGGLSIDFAARLS